MTAIAGVQQWPTNGHLIADVARLGYLNAADLVLDATFGRGTFWSQWRPRRLVTLDRVKGNPMVRGDFRSLPFRPGTFDAIVFDPPYKLNGTPSACSDGEIDERYGVDQPVRWQDRHTLIRDGIDGCLAALRRGGTFILKCQDQVCSGHVRWQTDEFTRHAESRGCVKVDRFDLLGGRPQPVGRRQVHARRNTSTLLVFRAAG